MYKLNTQLPVLRTHTHTHTHMHVNSLIANISKWSRRSLLDTVWAYPVDIPLAPLEENTNSNHKLEHNTHHYKGTKMIGSTTGIKTHKTFGKMHHTVHYTLGCYTIHIYAYMNIAYFMLN